MTGYSTYFETNTIQTMWNWHKDNIQINGTEEKTH